MPKKIELKTKKNSASVAGAISVIADPARRADAQTLLALMKKVSGKKPVMWGSSLIGFGEVPYKRSNGDMGIWLKIGFATRSVTFSLYLTCDLRDFSVYLKKLGTYKQGKGCLYIKRLADVDMQVLTRLVRAAYKAKPTWAH